MVTHPECNTLELEKKFAAFEASAKLLKDVPKKTEHWTQASAKTESQRVVQALTLFEQYSNDDFVKALAVLKKVWHAMLSERSQDRRKLGLHVRNVCGNGVLAKQGFPKSLSTFFGSNFLGIQVGMQDISLKYVPSESGVFKPKEFDPSLSVLCMLRREMVSDPVMKSFTTLKEYFADSTAKVTTSMAKAFQDKSDVMFVTGRVSLKDTAKSTSTDKAWLPKSLGEGDMSPLYLDTLGLPWVCVDRKWACRVGNVGLPCDGVGRFLHVHAGAVAILAFPYSVVTEAGADVSEIGEWLDGITSEAGCTFFSKEDVCVIAAAGDLCWVPYGWYAATVSLQDDTLMTQVLYFSKALRSSVDAAARDNIWARVAACLKGNGGLHKHEYEHFETYLQN